VIRATDSACACYPVVSIVHSEGNQADEIINTAEDDALIAVVDGTPVEAFLFGTRQHRPLAAA
jgi:hypothetical protein